MSAPSVERVAKLAPFWNSVSIHEAGHAVIGLLLGVRIHHLRLDYERVGLFRWEVTGYTGIGTNGHSAVVDEHVDVLFTLAGLEAEALWISTMDNVSFERAQAEVESRRASHHDLESIAASLPDSGMSLDEARAQAQDLVLYHWLSIEDVAAALRVHRWLSGADVADIARLT